MFTIAHVTDTHFGNRAGVRARNERVVEHLTTLRPDVVLITGDVADHGLPEEYAEAREVYGSWDGPLFWLPGNHDVRHAYARHLLGIEPPAGDGPVLGAHESNGVRFLMLDSLVSAVEGDRIDHGELSETSLQWLRAELADDRPTFVCLHHPPVTIGVDFMDKIRLRDPDSLEELIHAHPHVVATLVGHAHGMITSTFAGRPLLIGGAVSSMIPLRGEGYAKKIVNEGPVSYALHLLLDDDRASTGRRLVTHWRALAD
ncbi:MAG: metallophosphoesterase [Nocardioides sp.]|jgi:Icc protein